MATVAYPNAIAPGDTSSTAGWEIDSTSIPGSAFWRPVGESNSASVIEVAADFSPTIAQLKEQTYINTAANAYTLTGDWWDGSETKQLGPGEAVTITMTSNGKLFVVSNYENQLSSNIGSGNIGDGNIGS